MLKRFYCFYDGRIKIPHPLNICFEGEVEAIIDIAKETGETSAKVENLEMEVKEQEEKTEEIEQSQQYTREEINRLFERAWDTESEVYTLKSEVEELKARLNILEAEVVPEEKPEEKPEEEPEPEPELIQMSAPAKVKKDSSGGFSLLKVLTKPR